MTNTTNSDGVCLDVFRKSHTAVAGISQMMDIGTGHLAHQCDLPDSGNIRTLLGSANSRDGQTAQAVGKTHQIPYIFHSNTGYCSGGRQQNNIRTGRGKGRNIFSGDDLLCIPARSS